MVSILAALLVVLTTNAITLQATSGGGQSTPRRLAASFLYHTKEAQPDYNKAGQLLSAKGLSESDRAQRAAQLREVLDARGLYLDLQTVPDAADYIDSATRSSWFQPLPEEPRLAFVRVDGRWFVARSTVDVTPAMVAELYPFGLDALADLVPRTGKRIFGLLVWHWIALAIVALLAVLCARLLRLLVRPILGFICKRVGLDSTDAATLNAAARPLALAVTLETIGLVLPLLRLPGSITRWLVLAADIGLWVFIAVALYRFVDLIAHRVVVVTQADGGSAARLVPLLSRVFKIVVVLTGLVIVLQRLDINLAAILAGLSIGGAALALASQDTIKNVFGSFTIMTDRPFVVGDWIIVSGAEGIVEDIGLRSTRIRTFADSVITIPNGRLADMTIDNMGLRIYRRYRTLVGIEHEATPDQVTMFCDGVRTLLLEHPKTLHDPERVVVGFFEYDASALTILVQVFMSATGLREELEIRQEINLGIMRVAERSGVAFAFPTRKVHIEGAAALVAGPPANQQPGKER
jgi:MscS family membrane protein